MSIFKELGVREGADRSREEMLYNLAACYNLAEKRINTVLGRHGLSTVKMNALLMVKHVGKSEGISQVDIGKKMIVSAGNITRLVDRLEREKLVERTPTKDRRVKLIRITKKGSGLLDKVWPVYKKEVNQIACSIPDSELARTKKALHRFRLNLTHLVKDEPGALK